ncbi:MAG: hypothetical protein ACP5E4_01635 [Candidatus Aenigmatarchaeota archaeon]
MNLKFIIDKEYDKYWATDASVAKVFGYTKKTLTEIDRFYDSSMPVL